MIPLVQAQQNPYIIDSLNKRNAYLAEQQARNLKIQAEEKEAAWKEEMRPIHEDYIKEQLESQGGKEYAEAVIPKMRKLGYGTNVDGQFYYNKFGLKSYGELLKKNKDVLLEDLKLRYSGILDKLHEAQQKLKESDDRQFEGQMTPKYQSALDEVNNWQKKYNVADRMLQSLDPEHYKKYSEFHKKTIENQGGSLVYNPSLAQQNAGLSPYIMGLSGDALAAFDKNNAPEDDPWVRQELPKRTDIEASRVINTLKTSGELFGLSPAEKIEFVKNYDDFMRAQAQMGENKPGATTQWMRGIFANSIKYPTLSPINRIMDEAVAETMGAYKARRIRPGDVDAYFGDVFDAMMKREYGHRWKTSRQGGASAIVDKRYFDKSGKQIASEIREDQIPERDPDLPPVPAAENAPQSTQPGQSTPPPSQPAAGGVSAPSFADWERTHGTGVPKPLGVPGAISDNTLTGSDNVSAPSTPASDNSSSLAPPVSKSIEEIAKKTSILGSKRNTEEFKNLPKWAQQSIGEAISKFRYPLTEEQKEEIIGQFIAAIRKNYGGR